MPDLPPPPPTPAPPPPAPKPPAAAPDLAPLNPYDNLLGDENASTEQAPTLTFNVAQSSPPPAAAPREPAPKTKAPGMIASDDPPTFVPPLPADEPPEPLLRSPVVPGVPAPRAPAPPLAQGSPSPAPVAGPVAAPGPTTKTIAQLLEAARPPLSNGSPPAELRAGPGGEPPAPPVPERASIPASALAPAPVRAPSPPAPAVPVSAAPRQAASPRGSDTAPDGFERTTPMSLQDRLPPAPAPAPAPAGSERPVPVPPRGRPPLEADTLIPPSGYDNGPPTLPHGGMLQSAEPEADTVIAVAPPLRRASSNELSSRVLGGLLLVLLALWLLRLGASPLIDVDEGAFAEATRELITGNDWGSTTLNGADRFDKPILVYWLQAISLKIFGVNEFAVRLPSALCAFVWCVAIGQFAWRRYGRAVAIAAVGVLATSLLPMFIGRAATADALLNMLLTLSTLDLWRHLENGQAAPRRRAFAWIGLGLLAKGPVALLIPAAAAGLWLGIGRDRSRLMRLVGDPKAWLLMIAIATPWYAYAVLRHGWAFIDGFLLHHNLQRFGGSLEGHAGSLGYYIELLPVDMLPWTALLVPFAMKARTRWNEPLGRFLQLWFAFVLVFFSLSGTKLPHYILYGFTPLVLLLAQELVTAGRGVRFALCLTMLAVIAAGAASPWIAQTAAEHTNDPLYRTLLSTAPSAPWVWVAVPVGLLVFGLVIWLPNVRNYLSEADGAVAAGVLTAGWLILAVIPWWGRTLQEPIRTLARTLPLAQLNLMDRQALVQWRLHQPSIGFYVGQPVERRDPVNADWALTRVDRLSHAELDKLEVVQQVRGYALVRPSPAASEPLARIGAAAEAASAAAVAAAAASAAEAASAAAAAEAASQAAAASAAAAGLAPASSAAPAAASPPTLPARKP
jgi:4-amino-4-deoxy-L-arabinose transferase-like glycosyltransferase